MRGKCIVVLFLIVLVLSAVKSVNASVIINEILFDPPDGLLGDSNGDGVRSSRNDEFVELFNSGNSKIDISNWLITDALSSRHIFSNNSFIDPFSVFVVFGGGSPSFMDFKWETASTKNLGFNNGADIISLFDAGGVLIDEVEYGSESVNDQSIVRSIEGTRSEWINHADLKNSQGKLYSPGYLVNVLEDVPLSNSAVPEPITILTMALGLGGMFLVRNKS